MADAFKCADCHMTFGTVGLLQKHKRKFCVGGSLGDPDNLLLRKGLYSAESPRQRPLSPDDKDYPHYNPNQEAQLRQLAENHGRQMEYLQIKNRDLEKQREDIRRRLEQLGQKGPGSDNTADLLAELRAQEERNQKALNDLKRQLYEMGHKRVNVIEVEKPINYPQPIIQQLPPPPPPKDSGRKSYIYPVYFGSSLVAEISAVRQAYLQNGGNDPDVLAQMSQMQAEAQRIEDEMKNSNYDNRHREKKTDVSGKMTMIELENERLHKELMLLQEQNFLNQNRRKTDREGKYKGHSGHTSEGHSSYQKHYDSAQVKKSDTAEYSINPDHHYRDFMSKDYKDKHRNVYKYVATNTTGSHSEKNVKPVVPPLDLSSITGKKVKTNVLPKIHPESGNIAPTYTFMAPKKNVYFPGTYEGQQNRKAFYQCTKALPDRHLPKISYKGNKNGRSQSLYMPRKTSRIGSLKGSIRSEIIGGMKEDISYPIKHQMKKGDYSDADLVGVLRAVRPQNSRSNVLLDYYGPKANNDMNYETVTIKQREELNPDNNHVIHTTTYKEEKLNGHVN